VVREKTTTDTTSRRVGKPYSRVKFIVVQFYTFYSDFQSPSKTHISPPCESEILILVFPVEVVCLTLQAPRALRTAAFIMYRFLIRSSRINSARALSLARKQVSDLGRGLHEHADDALVSATGRKVTPHLPRPQYAPPRGGQQFRTSQLLSGRSLLELNSATLDSARCRDHRTSHYFPLLPLRNLREVCHRTTDHGRPSSAPSREHVGKDDNPGAAG
jgi:hypothetical protein